MKRLRSSNGKFTKGEDTEPSEASNTNESNFNFLYTEVNMSVPKISIINLLKIIICLVLISPWVFIAHRKGSLSAVSETFSTFYEEKFSIQYCPLPTIGNSTLEKNKTTF